jgi:hypothetical protein
MKILKSFLCSSETKTLSLYYIYVYNNSRVLATYKFVVVAGCLIAMAERDHEQLAVAV